MVGTVEVGVGTVEVEVEDLVEVGEDSVEVVVDMGEVEVMDSVGEGLCHLKACLLQAKCKTRRR